MPEGSPDRHPPLGGDGHDEVGLPAPHRLLHRVPARGQVDSHKTNRRYQQILFTKIKVYLQLTGNLTNCFRRCLIPILKDYILENNILHTLTISKDTRY